MIASNRKQASVLLAIFLFLSLGFRPLPDSQFTLGNQTIYNLGLVTLSYGSNPATSGSTALTVAATGNYLIEVASSVESITISNQTVVRPTNGIISLGAQNQIAISWSGSSLVEVFDYNEMD